MKKSRFTAQLPGTKGFGVPFGTDTQRIMKYASQCLAEHHRAMAHLAIAPIVKEDRTDPAYEMVEAIDRLIAEKREDLALLAKIRLDEILPVNGLGEPIEATTSWR